MYFFARDRYPIGEVLGTIVTGPHIFSGIGSAP
jgi:hypothetical protein